MKPRLALLHTATALAAAALGLAAAVAAAPAVGPALDRARSGPCVEEPGLMRRIHMDVVRHGRDETVRQGIRDRRTSLAACVDCHANAKDGSVLGSDTHFCQGCHAYAAVKLDCFECHSSRAREPLRASAAAPKDGS